MQEDFRPDFVNNRYFEYIFKDEKTTKIFKIIVIIVISILVALWLWYSSSNNFPPETNKKNNTNISQKQINSITKSTSSTSNKGDKIAVHVAGNVINPGLYYFDPTKRVYDAVKTAGGFSQDADQNKINLAQKLIDGQYLYIPKIGETTVSTITTTPQDPTSPPTSNAKVNINIATQSELEEITGVGPSTAENIIKYRQENGNFSSIEDIQNVPGIGTGKFENMKDEIVV